MNLSKIKESRFRGLADQLDWLFWKFHDTETLSKQQIEQLKCCANAIGCFNQLGVKYYDEAQRILIKLANNDE